MEVHYRDLLISVKFSDFSFNNPVPLKWNQDGEVIGSAVLKTKDDCVYGDLIVQDHIKYNDVYPHVAVDVISQSIGFVFLDQNKPIDAEVQPLKEQLLKKK